jgi:aryl carrier-like protein
LRRFPEFRAKHTPRTIANSLVDGPSEASAIATIQFGDALKRDARNIGHGFGALCWIVDPSDHDKLLPIGAVGELLIEGPIVGRGYLSKVSPLPFIEQPVWLRRLRQASTDNETNSRVYKTGDLVQYDSEGSLLFHGRKDNQVKIRGQRVELEEIETHLRRFLGLCEVAVEVVISNHEAERSNLAAFITFRAVSASEDDKNEAADLGLFMVPNEHFLSTMESAKSHLQDSLPSYMVPDLFLQVTHIPLGVTGKTNRRQLREQAAALSPDDWRKLTLSGTQKQIPSTETEIVLQRLFACALGIPEETLGVNDSFFRLGGDSLVALKLVASAQNQGLNLSLMDIFRNPTISGLAITSFPAEGSTTATATATVPLSLLGDHAAQETIVRAAVEQCHLNRNEIEDIYPSTALQEGLMALTAKNQGMYTANFVFQLLNDVRVEDFQSAWQATIFANSILRTRIIQTESLGSFQVVVRSEMIHWDNESSLGSYLLASAQKPMVLGQALARFALIPSNRNHQPPSFVLTLHHSLYDAVSLGLIFRQVEDAYSGIQLQQQPFSPFVNYLQKSEGSDPFWRSQFIDFHAAVFPALPSATHIPSAKSLLEYTIKDIRLSKSDHTPFTFIRLAWAILVAHYTDAEDVVFGVTFSGREAPVKDM